MSGYRMPHTHYAGMGVCRRCNPPRDEASSPVTESAREAWRTPGFQSPPASWRDSVDSTPPDKYEAEADRDR